MYNSIYPNYANAYLGINNRQITRKKDEDKSSQSSTSAENNPEQDKHTSNNNPSPKFPNGEKVAIDYTRRKIGIDQVLADFKNTANAIGAPDDIKAEVTSYLGLAEAQAKKDSPSPDIIQSNLKNASHILDEYITKTLKKPSKVVENWVDTLFLQQIDYKSQLVEKEEEVSVEEPVVQIEQIEEQTAEAELVDEQPQNQQASSHIQIYIPSDPQLKRMFVQAKKYAAINNKEQALYSFQNTMEYAKDIGDVQTCAMIHFEEGKLYDEFNRLDDALYNYHKAAQESVDNNIKAKAHISMGKIYDDYVNFEPAVEHYCAAVSFAGEADNIMLQTKALTDLAQIHTDRYDKDNAFMFMDLASTMATETKNGKVKGITLSRNAKMSQKLGEKAKALSFYGNSAQSFNNIEDNENLAKNYTEAAEIMMQYGNSAKAKKLLSKAYVAAYKTDNNELKTAIRQQIENI